jgi:GDSL-like lipase/acylhydrolase family protein
MSRRKRLVFAMAAMLLAVVLGLAALLAADLYFHRRVERVAGVNIWGYRGPRVGKKARGEHRLIVIGGSTAFGYGVGWEQTFSVYLERDLRPISRNGAPVSVVNLGFNTQGAYAFRFAEEDYLGLDYDTVILYEGYNDLGLAPNEVVGRRDSPIFRLTGYYPIVHVALDEKAMALRSGGNLEAAYRNLQRDQPKTVFRPGLATRATASTLEAAAHVSKSLNEQLERFATTPKAIARFEDVHVDELGCGEPQWAHYCASVRDAVRFALQHKKKVLVVTQPYIDVRHREQQAALRTMLAAQYGNDSNVAYANLGEAIDLKNQSLAYDGMHLTPAGNAEIASRLVRPVAALMPEAFQPPAAARQTAR